MAELDQITASTRRYIKNARYSLVDNIFNQSATLRYVRDSVSDKFTGGRLIQENILYGVTPGGPYAVGGTFNIAQPQVEQALQFNVKYFYQDVTLFKEHIQVLNKGADTEIFSLVKSRTETAYANLGAQLALGLFANGQRTGFTNNINGLAEAINDGSTNSWDGNTYTTYGTITRGGSVGTAINSVPLNVNGTLEYSTLEEQYGNAWFGSGNEEPNVIATTVLGYSYVKEKFYGLNRYNDTQDNKLGINTMKFNNAVILADRYAPGSAISGTNDVVATAFYQAMAGTNYPTLTSETLWILNIRQPFFNFYVSDDPEYGFGFTGFKPSQNSTVIAGQMLFAGNITVPGPRYHRQLYGITG